MIGMHDWVVLCLAGAFGSLAKDVLQDGRVQLPFMRDGYFYLGFIGGMIVGAFVGFAVDHSPLTAALGGYVGTSAIVHLLPPLPTNNQSGDVTDPASPPVS